MLPRSHKPDHRPRSLVTRPPFCLVPSCSARQTVKTLGNLASPRGLPGVLSARVCQLSCLLPVSQAGTRATSWHTPAPAQGSTVHRLFTGVSEPRSVVPPVRFLGFERHGDLGFLGRTLGPADANSFWALLQILRRTLSTAASAGASEEISSLSVGAQA